jgi:hypothetical protein
MIAMLDQLDDQMRGRVIDHITTLDPKGDQCVEIRRAHILNISSCSALYDGLSLDF